MTMVAYIDSLMNLGALPVVQAPQSFKPNSTDNQQLVKQMQRGKLLSYAMKNWVNVIIKEGYKFILEFTTIYVEGETLLGEIQTLIPGWELNRANARQLYFRKLKLKFLECLSF